MESLFAAVSARINGNLMFIYDKSHAIFFLFQMALFELGIVLVIILVN